MYHHTEKQLTIYGGEVPVYINTACPAQCSTEHDVPDPEESWDDPTWSGAVCCPETGERYVYERVSAFGGRNEWRQSAYEDAMYLPDFDVRLTCPWEWNIASCDYCGEWFDTELGGGYCEHLDETRCEQHYDEGGVDGTDASCYARCYACGAVLHDDDAYLDGNTEQTYCREHAAEHAAYLVAA